MVLVKVELPPELDQQFKKKVLDRYGYKRGSISLAMLEAIKEWIEKDNDQTGKHDYVNFDEIRANYPNKYIILKDDEVVLIKDTLDEIYNELPTIKREKYQLLTPSKNKFNQQKGRKLGWRMKRLP